MWNTLRSSSRVDPALQQCMAELLEDTSRTLIYVTAGAYLGMQVLMSILAPDQIAMSVALTLPTLLVTSRIALHLLSRRFVAAQIVWLGGLGTTLTLLLVTTRQPEIAFLYALLPFMGFATLGWQGALYAELWVLGLVGCLTSGLLGVPMTAGHAISTSLAGCFGFLVAWAVCRALSIAALWSLDSFGRARKSMEEAQQHRAQLARVVKDLDQAYYRLERTNAALVAAWRTADQAKRLGAEFATTLSHELRTPLNLIIGFCDMMLTAPQKYGGVQIPAPYRSDLAAVRHNGRHLLSLVNDVLDLARLDAQQLTLSRDSLDIRAVVGEAVSMVQDYVTAKGLALEVSIDPDVPLLSADSLRIRQVLLNLLVNAARFTDTGSISVTAAVSNGDVVVRVTDTGRGIPEGVLPNIFDEFGQTSSAPTVGWPSTGLGLPISRKLVTLHGGRMDVESTYLKGSTFWFTLPLAQDADMPSAAPMLRQTWSMGPPPAAKRTVVLVRDDPTLDDVFQRHLQGYRVVGASHLDEGISMANEFSALAVVTDREEPPHGLHEDTLLFRCPLPSTHQTAGSLGAQGYLVKPITHERLWAAVESLRVPVGRVVVADDDLDMTRLVRRMLAPRIRPRDCLEVHSGSEALDVLRTTGADLLLLDLIMPNGDGYEVLARMKEDSALRSVPVIVLSAKDEANVRLLAPVEMHRPSGLLFSEVLRCLEANLVTLMPGWH